MNKIISLKKNNYGYMSFFVVSSLLLVGMLFAIQPVYAATFTQLTAQLDYGQTSVNVRNLQVFLSSNPRIYPQGLVTGYFGPLTKSAVMNFQNAYGISQVGRVGPQTLAKINSLIASGVALTGGLPYGNSTVAPTIHANSIFISTSITGATISWSTNEATRAMVYYSTTPFQLREAESEFTRPLIVGGLRTSQTSSLQNNQSISISGLQSNTMYYYIIEASDADGNFSYILHRTFVTN